MFIKPGHNMVMVLGKACMYTQQCSTFVPVSSCRSLSVFTSLSYRIGNPKMILKRTLAAGTCMSYCTAGMYHGICKCCTLSLPKLLFPIPITFKKLGGRSLGTRLDPHTS